MSIPSARARVGRLLSLSSAKNAGCPCHGHAGHSHSHLPVPGMLQVGRREGSTKEAAKEYAFEVSASNLRFGDGVSQEAGWDFRNLGSKQVAVFTDTTVSRVVPGFKLALESLDKQGISYKVYDQVKVEPSLESWTRAIDWVRGERVDAFLAIGGGSVMDTCKVANLFSVYPEPEFGLLDFVNRPVGKGRVIDRKLRPLIAIPTTAGTGSETTGTAIYDHTPLNAKTGIASRAMRPLLGIVDPLNLTTCPKEVQISAGLDVLFHSLESYTTVPYTERKGGRAASGNPAERPAYQGSNPVSDVFAEWSLRTTVANLIRIARDPEDREAQRSMLLASSFAGIGFGNAGLHLPHAFSYAVSGLNKKLIQYQQPGYEVTTPLVPHGISVAITGPSVFKYTAPSSPDRHRLAAEIFNSFEPDNVNLSRLPDSDLGPLLKDRIARYLVGLGIPRGISALGYKKEHIPQLVEATLPQRRVLDLAPVWAKKADEHEEQW
ncbi:alcohol dehydrogenase [Atractiella rhizophila]|nr:alcohol dehydrogenase [Atractiella rhizophila]